MQHNQPDVVHEVDSGWQLHLGLIICLNANFAEKNAHPTFRILLKEGQNERSIERVL